MNMLIKVYWSIWVGFALATFLLFATGNLTMMSGVVMGFVAFGLTFMGMMGVLPAMVSHPADAKPVKTKAAPAAIEPKRQKPSRVFGIFKSA